MKTFVLSGFALAALAMPAFAQSDNSQKLKDSKTRIENITNYNTPQVSTAPVKRIAPTGTQTMTPNAASKYGPNVGLKTTAPPSPKNENARTNLQGRNINPNNDPRVAKGIDNYRRPAAINTPARTTITAPVRTTTTTAAPVRSTTTATVPVRSTPTYSTSSSSSSSSSSSASKKK